MIKMSTPATNPSVNDAAQGPVSDNLEEGEILFYESIKKDLNQLVTEPQENTIQRILDYSKAKNIN
jgi:hypothetical protein